MEGPVWACGAPPNPHRALATLGMTGSRIHPYIFAPATLRRPNPARESPLNPPAAQTVLSGLRPTGRVHLGNYFGAVRNWVQLQDTYECFYFVADWHALTSDYADPSNIPQATFAAVEKRMAAGMDTQKT